MCELSDQIAAIAPVEGAQNLECRPSTPVSLLVFHGTADRLVAFDGGETKYQIGPKRTDSSVASAVAFWVKQDGCHQIPHKTKSRSACGNLFRLPRRHRSDAVRD